MEKSKIGRNLILDLRYLVRRKHAEELPISAFDLGHHIIKEL